MKQSFRKGELVFVPSIGRPGRVIKVNPDLIEIAFQASFFRSEVEKYQYKKGGKV